MPEQVDPPYLGSIPIDLNRPVFRVSENFPLWGGLMIFGLLGTVLMFFVVRDLENQTARSDFTAVAEQRLVLLDSSIQRSVDHLLAVGAYFDATSSISRTQFKNLTSPILDLQQSLQALSWDPVVTPDEVKKLVAFTQYEGFKDFNIYELGADKNKKNIAPRSEYFPVWFIEPFKGNEKAFGFDLGSNPARMIALEMARKQGRPIATSRITLVQDTTQQFGFLLFRPVYVNAISVGIPIAPGIAAPQEVGRLKGFISGVFRIGRMIETPDQNKDKSAKPMQIYLFDQYGKPGEQLLYPQESIFDSEDKLPEISIKRTIQVGGRTWIAAAMPAGNAYAVERTASWLIAMSGLLLTLLGTALQRQTAGKAKSIKEIVTERTRALQDSEQRLMQANQKAEEASRMKTVFLASMSHEFRTPMNAVIGLLHVLSRTPLDESQRDYVSKISGAAKRLLRLIEDILDVSRIEAGKLSIEQSQFKIETVFRDVLVAVSPKLNNSHVELIFDIDPELPFQLIGDAMRLTQVMVNLVDNAAKFTSEGQIIVSVRAEIVAERRMYLHVSVKDSGVGMQQEECDRLFQPFVQAESMNRKKFGGTGLGLAICRQLVELMGGEIHATSILGEGSHFQFSIPLGVFDAQVLCAPSPELLAQSVLLLESHELAGESLERLLKAMGAKVTRVTSNNLARAALEVFDGSLMLIAESFPEADSLIKLAFTKVHLRSILLSPPGASARDSYKHFEKPLLPHTIHEIFGSNQKKSQAFIAEPVPQFIQQVGKAQEEDFAHQETSYKNLITSSVASISPEFISQLRALKALLIAGDPHAEECARELKQMASGTGLDKFANSLLIQCNNYDFKKALATLAEVLPPEKLKEDEY